MAQQTAKERYLTAYEAFDRAVNGRAGSPVRALRQDAVESFSRLDFPTTHDEEWRYTSVAPLLSTPFRLAGGSDLPADATPFALQGLSGARLTFVDGRYSPGLSVTNPLPRGARAGNLAEAIRTDADLVCAHLGRYAPYREHAFSALNTAFLSDGAFVHVPRGAAVEHPIHILYLSTASGDPTVSHPRTLVVAEEASQVTIVETYAGPEGSPYFTNALTEVAAGESAVVDHYKLELEGHRAFHIAGLHVRQAMGSRFTSHAVSLGGGLVRNEVNVLLAGEGAEATLNGFYLLDDAQHVDNHTLIEHAEPRCASHQFYKGILDGASRGVFRGKIHVRQKAQKTDAYQSNRNLLLSGDAEVTTKPQLEIYADDVKCSHGATVGQLDGDALFYLRARGVGIEAARRILVHAFAGEVIDRIAVEPIRTEVDRLAMEKFQKAHYVRGTR